MLCSSILKSILPFCYIANLIKIAASRSTIGLFDDINNFVCVFPIIFLHLIDRTGNKVLNTTQLEFTLEWLFYLR